MITTEQPFKSRTYLRKDGELVSTYCQCYEFVNKSKMLFFVSEKRKERGVLEVTYFTTPQGSLGNRYTKYYVSVYTPRVEK